MIIRNSNNLWNPHIFNQFFFLNIRYLIGLWLSITSIYSTTLICIGLSWWTGVWKYSSLSIFFRTSTGISSIYPQSRHLEIGFALELDLVSTCDNFSFPDLSHYHLVVLTYVYQFSWFIYSICQQLIVESYNSK